jgi:hypothetical protein
MPPRDPDRNVIYDDSMAKWRIEAAINARQAALDAPLKAKQRDEEYQKMLQVQEQQRKDRERRQEENRNRPRYQYEMIMAGNRYKCGTCHMPRYYEANCRTRRCENLHAIDMEDGVQYMRRKIIDLEAEKSHLESEITRIQEDNLKLQRIVQQQRSES